MMDVEQLVANSQPFLEWLVAWYSDRPTAALEEIIAAAGGADSVAVLAVDVTVGFCSKGPLSSDRVAGIVQPIVALFARAHKLGVRHFILPQDAHADDAVEFGSYAPHCVAGTDEAQTVPELATLPFAELYHVMEKNSISSAINTELEDWLENHPDVNTFLVVGDCTDLCTYQLAMHLRLRANALNLSDVHVIVPMDGVDTYDLSVSAARELGAMPHSADLLHLVFLYSMALNGVRIVAKVE